MKAGEPKQFVPIFVGSTFVDLQDYRQSARDALTQLETIVRGMEYFGSKPGSPVEECLNVVRSCKIYIGIFGMRYGSIPEGHEQSMTQLEYEEAQKHNLPSLIYILDEENQPVLPKFVETGPSADKLRQLKELLKKRHMVSFFTNPQDLAAKILHDVPEVVRTIGAKIEGELKEEIVEADPDEILRKFRVLPKVFKGRDVSVEFTFDSAIQSVSPKECSALRIELGASVSFYGQLPHGIRQAFYAEREIAMRLLDVEQNSKITAKGLTAYGVEFETYNGPEGPEESIQEHTGVLLKSITVIAKPQPVEPPNSTAKK